MFKENKILKGLLVLRFRSYMVENKKQKTLARMGFNTIPHVIRSPYFLLSFLFCLFIYLCTLILSFLLFVVSFNSVYVYFWQDIFFRKWLNRVVVNIYIFKILSAYNIYFSHYNLNYFIIFYIAKFKNICFLETYENNENLKLTKR